MPVHITLPHKNKKDELKRKENVNDRYPVNYYNTVQVFFLRHCGHREELVLKLQRHKIKAFWIPGGTLSQRVPWTNMQFTQVKTKSLVY